MRRFPEEARDLLLAVVVGLALFVLATKLVGCSSGSNVRVESALDAIAVTIDPAYSLAMDVCAAQERAVVAARRAGLSAADADAAIAAVRPRCDAARETFEQIRLTHARAVEALQSRNTGEAERLLEHVGALWRELGGKGDT